MAPVQSSRPDWWVTVPRYSVSDLVRSEAEKRAVKMLRNMENAKLTSGQDFDMLSLVSLQRVCRDAGVSLAGKIRATAARDTMLRVATQVCPRRTPQEQR